jgi:hypothetical protein
MEDEILVRSYMAVGKGDGVNVNGNETKETKLELNFVLWPSYKI